MHKYEVPEISRLVESPQGHYDEQIGTEPGGSMAHGGGVSAISRPDLGKEKLSIQSSDLKNLRLAHAQLPPDVGVRHPGFEPLHASFKVGQM